MFSVVCVHLSTRGGDFVSHVALGTFPMIHWDGATQEEPARKEPNPPPHSSPTFRSMKDQSGRTHQEGERPQSAATGLVRGVLCEVIKRSGHFFQAHKMQAYLMTLYIYRLIYFPLVFR